MSNIKKKRIPKVGEKLKFFDDGKISTSRMYDAEVVAIHKPEDAKSITFTVKTNDGEKTINLYDRWKEEIDSHRQEKGFVVLNGIDTTPGAPWLYAEETDAFIECSIPKYDENNIWFVRTVRGGWFSIDIQSWWQSGELDTDGKLYEYYKEIYKKV